MSVVLLDSVLNSLKSSYPATLSSDDLFEVYCADNILVNFDLDYSEIESGIIDGTQDGGIDAAYILINRTLLTDDLKVTDLKQPIDIELIIIQAKNQPSFAEGPVDKLSSSLPILLDDKRSEEELLTLFKPEVVEVFTNFFDVIRQTSSQFPKVAVRVFYCSKGDKPNTVVQAKADSLTARLRPSFHTDFIFLGSQQLYDRSSMQKRLVLQLQTVGSPLSGPNSYVSLCKISDYMKFMVDDDGNLRHRIFESNVRAYQGEVEVNKEIAHSLSNPTPGLDFWWLNNGVTIVSDEAQFTNNRLVIANPLIVNGLQTSHELNVFSEKMTPGDARLILIRVIVETDLAKRDEIIRATNRQTQITHSSFRATEPIHREIEDFLLTKGFFYDRRKNHYKREGKPADKIISIDRLAQAALSVLMQEPQTARARPTTALKSASDYAAIFSTDRTKHPLEMYGVLVQLLETVEIYFRSIKTASNQVHRNNLKFHVLMVLSWALNGGTTLPALRIPHLDLSKLTDARLASVTGWVFSQFDTYGPTDKTAKDSSFTTHLQSTWEIADTEPAILPPTAIAASGSP